ncbi:MAG: pentapeptide repeat-containing protein [Cyanobacteria bacterium J06650_10]
MKNNISTTFTKKVSAEKQDIAQKPFLEASLSAWHGLSVVLTTLLMIASPGLAETPARVPAETLTVENLIRQNPTHQSTVRRLVLLNECRRCDLTGVLLREAQLRGADLRGASLRFADLSGSHLEEANLKGANLTGINLSNAILVNTNLADTRLDWANFSGAQLYTVNVTGASMSNLNLTNAQLHNTPISVGDYEQPLGTPLEHTSPFEDTLSPSVEYEY